MALYIDNLELLKALKEYRANCNKAKKAKKDNPRVPEFIGECILKIAQHLSFKNNFINYSYKDEMISDGVENCIQYINNFNPRKSKNPFAYFTQIIYYAFIRRIQKEKHQSTIKNEIIQHQVFDSFDVQEHDKEGEYLNSYVGYLQKNQDHELYVQPKKAVPKKKAKKKKKVKKNSLKRFMVARRKK